MRGANTKSLILTAGITILPALAIVIVAAAEGLRGDAPINEIAMPPAIAKMVSDDNRQVRNYPEQPPVIPHRIRDYQIDLRFNKCLTCHSRTAAPAAGATMVSVTHFMNREMQMLTEVSPRRYFCTQCHVQQAVSSPPVGNTFVAEE